jgi:hypothetical protein
MIAQGAVEAGSGYDDWPEADTRCRSSQRASEDVTTTCGENRSAQHPGDAAPALTDPAKDTLFTPTSSIEAVQVHLYLFCCDAAQLFHTAALLTCWGSAAWRPGSECGQIVSRFPSCLLTPSTVVHALGLA